MDRGTVLIVSNAGDIHCEYLINACERLGKKYFRWNTDRFRISGNINWSLNDHDGTFDIDDHQCRLSEVGLLIYRRPVAAREYRTGVEPWVARLLDVEWATVERSLSLASNATVVNSIDGTALARNKIVQLLIARKVGLNVPETLLSSDIRRLKQFLGTRPCVTKGIDSSFALCDGVLRSGMTSRVCASDLNGYNSEGCVTLLQEEIPAVAMWRVVTIGIETFGFRLSGENLNDEVDSRKIETLLECTHRSVPNELSKRIVDLCTSLGIMYASSDFIEDKMGVMWFIDLNPEGQWAAYESRCNIQLSDKIIQLGKWV